MNPRSSGSFAVLFVFLLATAAPAMAQTIPAGPLGALQQQMNALATKVATLEATVATLQSARPKLLALAAAGDKILFPLDTPFSEFVDIPGTTVSFNTDNTSPICISATISLESSFESEVLVRVLLDGNLMQGHGLADVLGFDGLSVGTLLFPAVFRTISSYTVWSCDVVSGPHTVQVQWKNFFGSEAEVRSRTVVIQK